MAAPPFPRGVRRVLPSLLLAGIGGLLLPSLAIAEPPPLGIMITDLGTLDGNFSEANGINNQGQIVGQSLTALGEWHAVLWQDGTLSDLGQDEEGSRARDINDQGQVVGTRESRPDEEHAFLWQNGTMTGLGTLGGRDSDAWSINNQGQIVGASSTASDEGHAFLWQAGTMTDLGTLGGSNSTAADINDQGQIVGASDGHAFLWQAGTMTDLDPFTVSADSSATDINEQGQIVGYQFHSSGPRGGVYRAILWQNSTITDLGTLGGMESYAHSINDQGQIVGWSTTADGYIHAFLWQDGTMTDLGILSGANSAAHAINNIGQIVGWSNVADGETHAVLWTLQQSAESPLEQIRALIDAVGDLVQARALNKGQGQALLAKLNGAHAKLDRGNSNAAANQLHAFLNQVDAFHRTGKLTSAQAQPLIDQATSVIEQLRH